MRYTVVSRWWGNNNAKKRQLHSELVKLQIGQLCDLQYKQLISGFDFSFCWPPVVGILSLLQRYGGAFRVCTHWNIPITRAGRYCKNMIILPYWKMVTGSNTEAKRQNTDWLLSRLFLLRDRLFDPSILWKSVQCVSKILSDPYRNRFITQPYSSVMHKCNRCLTKIDQWINTLHLGFT